MERTYSVIYNLKMSWEILNKQYYFGDIGLHETMLILYYNKPILGPKVFNISVGRVYFAK